MEVDCGDCESIVKQFIAGLDEVGRCVKLCGLGQREDEEGEEEETNLHDVVFLAGFGGGFQVGKILTATMKFVSKISGLYDIHIHIHTCSQDLRTYNI